MYHQCSTRFTMPPAAVIADPLDAAHSPRIRAGGRQRMGVRPAGADRQHEDDHRQSAQDEPVALRTPGASFLALLPAGQLPKAAAVRRSGPGRTPAALADGDVGRARLFRPGPISLPLDPDSRCRHPSGSWMGRRPMPYASRRARSIESSLSRIRRLPSSASSTCGFAMSTASFAHPHGELLRLDHPVFQLDERLVAWLAGQP